MDPTPGQISAEFPGWHVWQDTSGLWYAARDRSSPPVWLRDENLTELRAQVASWERLHAPA